MHGVAREAIIPRMWERVRIGTARCVGLAAALFAACAAAAEGPAPPPRGPSPEELLREIRQLEAAVRGLQSQIDQPRTDTAAASAVVTVPGGARQSTSFNAPAPEFGPSDWAPSWPSVRNPSPQARERLPRELGAAPPPVDGPLDYPQFVPGSLTVEHGLGPREVNVTLALVGPDGSVNQQVDSNRIVAVASSPPNGTFTISNFNEKSVTVRWTAQRSPE